MRLTYKTIYLRLVEPEDADFVISLRVDERYNRHLSHVDKDVEKQRRWIEAYKAREQSGLEFYFIVHRVSDSLPIGTVRVYDFIGGRDSFCWGSWILTHDKTRYAALECALLIYDFCFVQMGFKRCHMDIRKQNLKVIAFHKRFGVEIVGETDCDLLGRYIRDDYLRIRDSIAKVIDLNSAES